MSLNLKFARAYASAGLAVFPLNGKQPATRHGFKDATTDLDQITQWWAENEYNIGLPVPLGVVAIDVDPRSGGLEGISQLERRYDLLPATTTCVSGRGDGGAHLYYKVPSGVFTDRHLPDGIDIRVGGRHYLVAAPSVHPDTGGRYYWTGPEYIAECPRWLLDIIRPPIKPVEAPQQRTDDISGNGLIRFVTELQEGNRNHGLFWTICTAISEGIWTTIKPDINQAAQHIGLTEQEIHTTAASAERRMS